MTLHNTGKVALRVLEAEIAQQRDGEFGVLSYTKVYV